MERLAQDGDGILLIYDNAVEADAIRPYLPRGGAARVLVTSNAHVWRDIAAPIQIGVWPKEVGGEFFVRRTSRAGERDAAVELSELLGGLPLAHEQAAAYCERLEIPLAEYARRFDAEPARLLDADKDAPAEYHDKLTVAKTFALAIEAAAKLHPAAEPLIVYAALLAPEPIPLLLFSEGREHFGEPFASAFAGDGLDEAVAALRAFALVDRESIPDERDPAIMTASIRLHRLVREVAALHFDRDSASIARGHLIAAVAAVYPEQVFHDASAWPRARRLDPLVMKLVTDIGSPSQDLALLISYVLDRLGSFRQRSLADHNSAKILFEKSLNISKEILGDDHSYTLRSQFNLAVLLEEANDLNCARVLYEKVLQGHEKIFGRDHPTTALTLDCLARVLCSQGDIAGALQLSERALLIHEKAFGAEHERTATNLSNLASIYRKKGDLITARKLCERAVDIREKVFGPEHLANVYSLYALAVVLTSVGEYAEAFHRCERSLEILEKVCGTEHPDSIVVRRTLDQIAALSSDSSGPSHLPS
jgi:tetratricopeptide (TPR) repeat protein